MNEYMSANRRHWDEVVPIHVGSEFYRVREFMAGESKLGTVEREELGDVTGRTLLHLQCHFGLDTLSWARAGAVVTGVDFSKNAIEAARRLAAEAGIQARFIESDVYDLGRHLDGEFDIVFTSYGVLCWLPDLARWAQVAAGFLRPGGTFYIVEFHPLAGVFDDDPEVTGLRVRYPYFPSAEPLRFDVDGTYAASTKLKRRATYEWPHPISEVATALIRAGLRIEFLHEFPFSTFRAWPFMESLPDRSFRLAKHDGSVPLMYSIKAGKPLAPGRRQDR